MVSYPNSKSANQTGGESESESESDNEGGGQAKGAIPLGGAAKQ